ncbi:hypothetical protein [Kribbella sp. CA-293567]|nr:hypothetical protein [Kribbella sp. CA-293567]WBQ07812.1 hypothetical protein OX958_13670 [Kribbella sp. CA-293567]
MIQHEVRGVVSPDHLVVDGVIGALTGLGSNRHRSLLCTKAAGEL